VIGRQVSHFYVIRLLGSGGMGVVYEAQDTRLPRSVAIKFLRPTLSRDGDAIRRFKREARLASSLNHPNICTILDVDEGEGQSFIAMELLHGVSLKSRLASGPIRLDEIVDIAMQIADALAVAHDQGIIHRDITPGNVFLTDGGLVKLLDFGLAKHFPLHEDDGQTTDELTTPGALVGTIHYMAPEQLDHDASVDYRCDLYSLGTVLYQMATGARPFDLSPRSALVAAIREQPHVPMRQLAPHHPAQLERIIGTLLAKRPDDRYQTSRTLRAELDLLRPTPQTTPARPGKSGTISVASVAVLPFDVIGDRDPDTLHFRDGLAADISRRLTASLDLRVAPRTSTRALAGRPVREIGQSLSVDTVLEGSLQRAGNRVRVTANLVDAASERSVFPALRVERRFEDILQTQDDVARELCDGLMTLLSRPGGRHTHEPEAYHAFRRALHHWKTCFAGGWRPAIEHFQYAIERDPKFAIAHVGMANAYNFLGFYGLMKPTLAFRVAGQAAERALAIDETLASAHREMALARFGGDWDWDGSEEAFRRAIALDAADPLAHVCYSWLLILLGRDAAAFAEAQKGHGLAPASRLVTASRAQTLYIGGRYDEAIDIATECLRGDPTYVFALHLRGLCYLATSVRDGAVADLEQAALLSNRSSFYLAVLGRCYGQFGMRDRALGLIAELEGQARDTYVAPQCYLLIYAGLGERQRALEYQERAYEDGASPFNYLAPPMRDLYALDPYHQKRLEQMRLIL
jgi:serine/threonine protein kinase/tetratricopeptide (TPR) repeat protein